MAITRDELAYHEAAHLAELCEINGVAERIHIAALGLSGAVTVAEYRQTHPLLLNYAKIRVHLAGPVAAAMLSRKQLDMDLFENSGDKANILTFIRNIEEIQSLKPSSRPFETAMFQTEKYLTEESVRKNWYAIGVIARALLAKNSINGLEAMAKYEHAKHISFGSFDFSAWRPLALAAC
jgi:hypothetical protein